MVSSSRRAFFLFAALTLTACSKQKPVTTAPASVDTGPIELGASPGSGRAPESTDPRAGNDGRADRANATIMELIHFDYDRAELSADAQRILQAKISVLREIPDLRIRIEGHADERGSDQYNDALGQQRAAAVKRFLVGYGIDGSRLEIVSFGEQRPRCRSESESCWAENRRAEFQVTAGGGSIR
jgi:peptidoglycan-associated lipoprotein